MKRLVASNFEKNVFITRSYDSERGPEIGPLDTLTGIYFKNGFLPIRETYRLHSGGATWKEARRKALHSPGWF